MQITTPPAYPKLEEAIRRNKIPKKEIAHILGISECSLSLKLHGKNDFKWREVKTIKAYLEIETKKRYDYDELFAGRSI